MLISHRNLVRSFRINGTLPPRTLDECMVLTSPVTLAVLVEINKNVIKSLSLHRAFCRFI